jgi:hypothetical protein
LWLPSERTGENRLMASVSILSRCIGHRSCLGN